MTPSQTTVSAAPGAASGRLRVLLREWRDRRSLSQLGLAVEANVSQRHVSFIESGRAHPSRDMVLRIASALDLPLRARNELLTAAGFAAAFPDRPLDAAGMQSVRGALDRILRHHEPYPAMVLDRYWNVVMKNSANARIVARVLDADAFARQSPDGRLNFVRMMFSPDGMRPHVRNWDVVAPALIARVRREANANPGSPSEALLEEFGPQARESTSSSAHDDHLLAPAVPLELDITGATLRLVNMLTTFGTPQDVSVQELRVEMSFPADEASDRLLRRLAADG